MIETTERFLREIADRVGLDSVDALQLVVALDKKYGVKITDQEAAKKILGSVSAMARAVEEKSAASGA